VSACESERESSWGRGTQTQTGYTSFLPFAYSRRWIYPLCCAWCFPYRWSKLGKNATLWARRLKTINALSDVRTSVNFGIYRPHLRFFFAYLLALALSPSLPLCVSSCQLCLSALQGWPLLWEYLTDSILAGSPPAPWWKKQDDYFLLLGSYKHGALRCVCLCLSVCLSLSRSLSLSLSLSLCAARKPVWKFQSLFGSFCSQLLSDERGPDSAVQLEVTEGQHQEPEQ